MKYLNNIKSPSDLKSYSPEELEFICDELREYIISTINEIGGHLAPTLGTIELTTALHYVYNTPEDKLIWDTGHQAYAHKVLTGRFDSFKTIRKYKGLSGFLKRTESEYDVFGAGHASTSISAGLGMACARDLDNEKFKVVSIIGDGALTGGLAFEALNNAGHLKKQLLVIVNDNDMSISPNVGAFRNYLVKIATNKSYNYVRGKIGRLITRLPKRLKFVETLLKKIESSAKNFFLPTTIFEDLGFRYFGPIDGHNINSEAPIFQNVFAEVSCNLAKENKNIVAITAAMREGTGLVNFAKEFPDRYFDVGIAEAHGVTFSGGLAVNGKIPIVAIYSTFLQRGYDQIIHDIALQKLPVIFCLDRSGLVGEDGATHHGVLDIAYMKCIQGMVVTAPKDGNELQDLLFTATNHVDGPFSIRYPKESSIDFDNANSNIIKIGSWEVINKGDDILILAVGSMVKRSMDIVENLKERDIKSEVVNCRFIKPMDLEYLENNCSKFSKIVTIEEGVLDGGFGESIAAWSSSKKLKNDILNIGLPNDFVDHGPRNILLEEVGLDSKALYEKIVKFVDR